MKCQTRPHDDKGRFVPLACPECGVGTLRREGNIWRCDGLAEPERDDQELEACEFTHSDGQAYDIQERS